MNKKVSKIKQKNEQENCTCCKNYNGITLIALVITIIVMLILVAVTISIAVNGGLFNFAGNAAKETELAKQNEFKLAEGQIEVNGKKYDSPEDFINGIESGSEKFSVIYTETAEYEDENGDIAVIPKGFSRGTSEGINKVEDGLVIRDDEGNEFVWIPVSASTNAEFENIRLSNEYTEPIARDQTEYEAMRTSVITNGGFYIARYEAGYSMTEGITYHNNVEYSLHDRPLSKKLAYPYTGTGFGYDVINISRAMYTNQTNYGVKSTLTYGIQWDAMLRFLGKENETQEDAMLWGNFADSPTFTFEGYYYATWPEAEWKNDISSHEEGEGFLLQTGASETNCCKNIYDIVGNLMEYTMEDGGFVMRGGSFSWYSSASYRQPSGLDINDENFGFRPALYII